MLGWRGINVPLGLKILKISGILFGTMTLAGPIKGDRVFHSPYAKFTSDNKITFQVPINKDKSGPVGVSRHAGVQDTRVPESILSVKMYYGKRLRELFPQINPRPHEYSHIVEVEVPGTIEDNESRKKQFQGLLKCLAINNKMSEKEFITALQEKGLRLYPYSWPVQYNRMNPNNRDFVSKVEGQRKSPTETDYIVDEGFGLNLVVGPVTDKMTIENEGSEAFKEKTSNLHQKWKNFVDDESPRAQQLREKLHVEKGDYTARPIIKVQGGEVSLSVLIGNKMCKNLKGEMVDIDNDDCHYGHAALREDGNNGELANGILKLMVEDQEVTGLFNRIRTEIFDLPTLEEGRGEPFRLGLSWCRIGLTVADSNAVLRDIMTDETRRIQEQTGKKLDEDPQEGFKSYEEVPFERFIKLAEKKVSQIKKEQIEIDERDFYQSKSTKQQSL